MLLIPYYSQAKEKEDRMLPEITLIGGDPLSSVSGILRNIAEARSDLHEDNLSGAKEAVSQAYTDIRFIRTFSPVAQVKNYIWIANLVMFTKTVIPQITFGELGIREGAAVYFLKHFGESAVAGLNAALFLFLINILFPALIGLIFLLQRK